jgi:hypothetical protein
MTLLQKSFSLPDLGISSSSPNYNTISTEQLTPSIYNGSKPNLADEHPHPTVASPYASHSHQRFARPCGPGHSLSIYLFTVAYNKHTTPLNDSMNLPHPHPYFGLIYS